MLKAYKPMLRHIYEKFADRQRKPGEKLNLSVDEFAMILEESGILEDELCG